MTAFIYNSFVLPYIKFILPVSKSVKMNKEKNRPFHP